MHLLRSLRLPRNGHLPIVPNHPWVLRTVQHPPDRHLIRILEASHSKSINRTLPLQRQLISPAYTLIVLHLFLHRPTVRHNDCPHILLSRCPCSHLHRQYLQALEAMHRLVLLPVQHPIPVVLHLVRREMAETTGTR